MDPNHQSKILIIINMSVTYNPNLFFHIIQYGTIGVSQIRSLACALINNSNPMLRILTWNSSSRMIFKPLISTSTLRYLISKLFLRVWLFCSILLQCDKSKKIKKKKKSYVIKLIWQNDTYFLSFFLFFLRIALLYKILIQMRVTHDNHIQMCIQIQFCKTKIKEPKFCCNPSQFEIE